MKYQPIKFTRKQYRQLKKLVRREFGNVSMTKGLFLISYIYDNHTNTKIKKHFRNKYYTPFNKKKLRCRRNNGCKY